MADRDPIDEVVPTAPTVYDVDAETDVTPAGAGGASPDHRRRRLGALGLLAAAVAAAVGVSALRSGPDPIVRRDVAVYAGFGAWIDTYDFVPTYSGPNPPVTPGTVGQLADKGVRTIYLQPVRNDAKTPGGLVDPDLLADFLARAHAEGIAVVGWSTPRFVDVAFDLERLTKIADFDHKGQRFDGVAVDIEDNESMLDPVVRSANLIELSKQLRAHMGPERTIGAIVMPTVQLDIVNPDFWPAFPWGELRPLYDVWMPMTYWTTRDADSGWRDAERYTVESVRIMRERLLDPEARVHPIGGIADKTTVEATASYLRSLELTGAIGGSLYDVATTSDEVWNALKPLEASLTPLPAPTTTAAP